MKTRLFLLFLIVCLSVAFVGCTTYKASGLQMGLDTSSAPQVLGTFERTITIHKFLGAASGPTLANIGTAGMDSKISGVIREEIEKKGGTGAIGISIDYEASFVNILLNAITGGIYAPSKVTIKGTVVK